MNESHKYKLVFFHLPKNAGVSVRRAIGIDRKSHKFPFTNVSVALGIDVKANTLDSIYESYHKFAIVRNPYERMVSLYNFRKQGNDLYDYVNLKESSVGPDGKEWGFNRWILSPEMKGTDEMGQKRMLSDSYLHAYWYFKDKERGYIGRNYLRTHTEFLNQVDFLTNPLIGGRLMPDTIIRQENLIEEWNSMFNKLGYKAPELGKSNTSKHTKKKTHYSHYYNDESYEFVTKLFKKDLNFLDTNLRIEDDKKYHRTIKKDLQKYESIPERIEALKDSYKGETCYIVSAGPSLKNYEPEYLKSKLENKLVFTIKQSYLLLKEICDFHILNFTNFEPYQWLNETIVAWEVFEQYHPQMILENGFNVDVMFPVIRNHGTMDNTQAARLDFDDFTMDKTYDRAWGPGLMYEMAIPLAMFLGCKEIITIGWDIGDISKFDGSNENEEQWQDHFYEGKQNIKYAPTPMTKKEIELVTDSVPFIHKWLKEKGIDFKICSDRNPADKSIPRVEL